MKVLSTPIKGAYILDIEPIQDERGFFARSLCAKVLEDKGLESRILQESISFNVSRGTLRGMHLQRAPHEEVKFVRVTQGAIYDVILDLRHQSTTYLKWFSVELSQVNRRTLYIPKGVAHGFQTLMDSTEVFYQMTENFEVSSSIGYLWNDPAFGIKWPNADRILSKRDSEYPLYFGKEI